MHEGGGLHSDKDKGRSGGRTGSQHDDESCRQTTLVIEYSIAHKCTHKYSVRITVGKLHTLLYVTYMYMYTVHVHVPIVCLWVKFDEGARDWTETHALTRRQSSTGV